MKSAVLTSVYLTGSPPILHTHSRFGDLRLEMGFVVMGLWGVLGNAHKEQFIVSSMNDLLKMSLVRMPGRGGGWGWMGRNGCMCEMMRAHCVEWALGSSH